MKRRREGRRAYGGFGSARGALDRCPCGLGEHDRGALRPLCVHLHIHLRGRVGIGVGVGLCVHSGVQMGRASEAACGAVECDELFARGVVGGGTRANVVLGLGVSLGLGVAAGVGGVEDKNGDAGCGWVGGLEGEGHRLVVEVALRERGERREGEECAAGEASSLWRKGEV